MNGTGIFLSCKINDLWAPGQVLANVAFRQKRTRRTTFVLLSEVEKSRTTCSEFFPMKVSTCSGNAWKIVPSSSSPSFFREWLPFKKQSVTDAGIMRASGSFGSCPPSHMHRCSSYLVFQRVESPSLVVLLLLGP